MVKQILNLLLLHSTFPLMVCHEISPAITFGLPSNLDFSALALRRFFCSLISSMQHLQPSHRVRHQWTKHSLVVSQSTKTFMAALIREESLSEACIFLSETHALACWQIRMILCPSAHLAIS